MAAADYYNQRPAASAQPSYLAPPPPPQRASSTPGLVYIRPQTAPSSSPQHLPHVPPPPPYQSPLNPYMEKPSVHFTPSPPPVQQRNSFSHLQRPNPQSWNPQYLPQQQHLAPPTSHPTGTYQQQQYAYQAPPPHMQPYINNNQSEWSLGSGYSSDPEPHHRRQKHSSAGRERGTSTGGSRSAKSDALLGAAGGSLIGDLIFPGLGTVGGALAGWFGGKDYGHHRKWREQKREKEQREWERTYGSRTRERDSGERRGSHDRRRSHE